MDGECGAVVASALSASKPLSAFDCAEVIVKVNELEVPPPGVDTLTVGCVEGTVAI